MSELLLQTRNLTKQYGRHRAVDDVNMHIKKGAIYGFIGRNGAGKTTCLKMISGLSTPSYGEIEMFGYKGKDLQKVRSRVGCLIEAPGLYGNMSAYDNLNIKCKLTGSKKKGYIEDGNFDFMKRLYIDSDEFGLNPKTSHPRFSEHFSDEIYYSEGDEETPFGSDEGHDTLICIFEAIRKNPNLDFSNFPQKLIEQDWDMEYVPITTLDADEVKKMAADKEMDMIQSDMVTYATAFRSWRIWQAD